MDDYQHITSLFEPQNIQIDNPDDLSAILHISQNGLEVISASSQKQQQVTITECQTEPSLTMFFNLEGTAYSSEKNSNKLYTIYRNQHVMNFMPHFEGNYSLIGERVNSFSVSMTEHYFERLMVNDLECLQRFWEKVSLHKEADISPVPLSITPEQKALILELQYCTYTGGMRSLFYESKVIELFLSQALQAECFNGTTCQTISAADKERLHAAKEYVETNLLKTFSLKHICMATGLNEFKLKKGFRELFGTTVFEYLAQLRMQYARKLLLASSLNIAEVAYTLGYGEPYNFTKAFKKYFGYLPSKLKV